MALKKMSFLAAAACVLLLLTSSSTTPTMGFTPSPLRTAATVSTITATTTTETITTSTQLNIFGNALKDAFSNDDTLGARKNEGLANGPNYNEAVTVNGKPVKGAVVGQKLTVVAGRARVKIPVNCQKGDCGTCMVKMNGRKVKACQATLGTGKCTIETL